MTVTEFSHNKARQLIPDDVLRSVFGVLEAVTWNFYGTTQEFRESLLRGLGQNGWSDSVRVDTRSKINITSIYDKTGLSVQTGNTSRIYADLLKLETLYKNKTITGAIYVVPTKQWVRSLEASNMASFERLVEELNVFNASITLPLMVYGVQGVMK